MNKEYEWNAADRCYYFMAMSDLIGAVRAGPDGLPDDRDPIGLGETYKKAYADLLVEENYLRYMGIEGVV